MVFWQLNVQNLICLETPWVQNNGQWMWWKMLHWDGKDSLKSKFNWMAMLGLVIVKSHRQMMPIWTVGSRFHIPHGYVHIWLSILALLVLDSPIPKLMVEEPWKDLSFVHTNDIYYKFVEDRAWLAKKVLDTWHIKQCVKWWCQALDVGVRSHLLFHPMVFLRCVIIGGWPLAKVLKRTHISNGTWFLFGIEKLILWCTMMMYTISRLKIELG